MPQHTAWQTHFSFHSKDVIVEPVDAQLSSDAGLIPFRQLDEQLQLTSQFAQALHDAELPEAEHSVLAMTRMRVFGILAGYEDQNDHDMLRTDPIFKLISGISPSGPALASQPTLSRFENRVTIEDLLRLRDVFMRQFLDSFTQVPHRLTFDIDPYADPAHGQQQLVFFHGHYDQHQYQVRLITCANNDLIVHYGLLYGSATASLGAEDDLTYLVTNIRERFPDVEIIIRADSAFATPSIFSTCEELRITYMIGMGMNSVLNELSADELELAKQQFAATKVPQRLVATALYKSRNWQKWRRVVIKVEMTAEGSNRRAVVTNRAGAEILPLATYDEYADRGESENRNKEIKVGLAGGRLSDHRYMANLFRVAMHCLAYTLLVRMRQIVAMPVPTTRPENTVVESDPTLPLEALPEPQRSCWFNFRQQRDPLGEGHIGKWRMRIIKVAAEVVETTRRIVIRLSGSWPYQFEYHRVSDLILKNSAT